MEERSLPAPVNAAIVALPMVGRSDLGAIGDQWERQLHDLAANPAPARVVFLGDSITKLFAESSPWRQFVRPLGGISYGFSGATTSEALWLLGTGRIAAERPRLVVVELGTNNLLRGQSGADAAEGVKAVVTALRAQLPTARIVVQGALPLGQSKSDPLRVESREFNRILSQSVGQLGALFVDVGQAFAGPDMTPTPGLTVLGVHPTAVGYTLYAANLLPAILASVGLPR